MLALPAFQWAVSSMPKHSLGFVVCWCPVACFALLCAYAAVGK